MSKLKRSELGIVSITRNDLSDLGSHWKMGALVSVITFALTLFSPLASIRAQAVIIPQLNLQEYDPSFMDQVYGQAYFLNSGEVWAHEVSCYLGQVKAQWENSAMTAIYNYVNSITTSDEYNDVAAYQDYAAKALLSQYEEIEQSWEMEATIHLYNSRDEFIQRINTNIVNESYLDRINAQNILNDQLNQQNSNTQQLTQGIESAAQNWNQNFNESYQAGLNNFSNTLSSIQDEYNTLIGQIDASEQTFQNNLDSINQYKNVVKSAVQGIVGQFEADLNKPCNSNPCLYTDSGGNLTAAGTVLQSLVNQLNAIVNDTSIQPDTILSQISTSINSFLNDQTNQAAFHRDDWASQIYTTQNSLAPSKYGTTSIENQIKDPNSFLGVSGSISSVWNQSNYDIKNFDEIADEEVQKMVKAIVSLNPDEQIKNFIKSELGANYDHNSIDLKAYNIYTDMGNGEHGPKVGGFYIANVGIYGPTKNWKKNPSDFIYWEANHIAYVSKNQMLNIGYRVEYTVKNTLAEQEHLAWSGNFSSLNGQRNLYQNKITPAVNNWESQVVSYNDFITQYQQNATQLKADATAKYEQALIDLEKSKSAWVNKMEDEKQTASLKWEDLKKDAQNVKTQDDLNAIIQAASLNYESSISSVQADTGANASLSTFQEAVTELSAREFTYKEKIEPENYSPNKLVGAPVYQSGLAGSLDIIGSIQQSSYNHKGGNQGVEIGEGFTFDKGINSIKSFVSPQYKETKFNILTAAQDKKIETSITIDGKDLSDVFSNTANGVYQYSQLIGINGINDYNRIEMQAKSINQAAFSVNWDARAVVSLNKEGELTTSLGFIDSKRLKDMMTYEYKGEKFEGVCIMGAMDYDSCKETQKRVGDKQSEDFDAKFKDVTDKLKIHGYEFQNGKVVKSLTREEKIRLGQIAGTQEEADKYGYVFAGSLTDAEKQITNCYENTGSCGNLLKQDFKIQFNDDKSVVTLSKIISNGRIDGKDKDGEYKSGTQVESRNIALARVAPVVAPKGKDLFDQWTDEDWQSIDQQNETVFNDFKKSLDHTSAMLAQKTAVVNSIESKNEKLFQERKKAQEEADSFLKDMVIAYLSGGMAGIKAAIKGKIEDKINMELAKAFIQATGGSPEQVQMMSDIIGFMKGKIKEKKVKAQAQMNNLKTGALVVMTGGWAAAGMLAVDQLSGGVMTSMTMGATAGLSKAVLGPRNYTATMDKLTSNKTAIQEIKANEKALVNKYTTTAVATATGLPAEVVSQIITDYRGSQEAKKTRAAVNANPIANIGSQVAGAVGGIIKTAAVAFGAKDRDIQSALADGNKLIYANSTGYNPFEMQSLAYANQALGMKAPGTTYTSNIPKDQEGIIKELGTRRIIEELAEANGWDKDIVNQALRGEMGRLEQQKADRNAQKDAARSTAITAVTTLATLGAAGALGSAIKGVMGSIGQFVGATGDAVAKIGAQVVKTAVQVIDGSRNGVQGMLAGLANGALGALTMGGSGSFGDGFLGQTANLLHNTGVGLGISYDGDGGWGGMVGVGGTAGNLGIQFSQHGDTTVSGGVAVSQLGVNLSGSYNMQTGSHTAGINYNISNNFRIGASHSSDGGLALTGGINASNSGSNGSSMNGGLNFSYCPDPIKVDTKKSLKGEEVDNEEKRKILTRV